MTMLVLLQRFFSFEPFPLTRSLFKIVSPFPPLLWLVLLSSMFVVAFTTFVIANLENKIIGRTKWPCTWFRKYEFYQNAHS